MTSTSGRPPPEPHVRPASGPAQRGVGTEYDRLLGQLPQPQRRQRAQAAPRTWATRAAWPAGWGSVSDSATAVRLRGGDGGPGRPRHQHHQHLPHREPWRRGANGGPVGGVDATCSTYPPRRAQHRRPSLGGRTGCRLPNLQALSRRGQERHPRHRGHCGCRPHHAAHPARHRARIANRLRGLLTRFDPHLERVLRPCWSGSTHRPPCTKAGRRRLVGVTLPLAPRMVQRLVEEILAALDEQTVIIPSTDAAALTVPSPAGSLRALLDQRKLLKNRIQVLPYEHPLSKVHASMPGRGSASSTTPSAAGSNPSTGFPQSPPVVIRTGSPDQRPIKPREPDRMSTPSWPRSSRPPRQDATTPPPPRATAPGRRPPSTPAPSRTDEPHRGNPAPALRSHDQPTLRRTPLTDCRRSGHDGRRGQPTLRAMAPRTRPSMPVGSRPKVARREGWTT